MKRLLWLLIVGLLVAACGPLGQPSAEEIVRRAEVAMENLESAHAVVEAEVTAENETMRVVGEGWMDGDRSRATVLEASKPEVAGTVAVSDGETGWLYHPEMNVVLTGDIEELKAYKEANSDAQSD